MYTQNPLNQSATGLNNQALQTPNENKQAQTNNDNNHANIPLENPTATLIVQMNLFAYDELAANNSNKQTLKIAPVIRKDNSHKKKEDIKKMVNRVLPQQNESLYECARAKRSLLSQSTADLSLVIGAFKKIEKNEEQIVTKQISNLSLDPSDSL